MDQPTQEISMPAFKIFRTDNRHKGSILVFSALAMLTFVSFAALVVDLGFGFVAKNQLHNIADAAALAGARQLGIIVQALPYAQQQTYVMTAGDRTAIESAAQTMGSDNYAGNVSGITINAGDIQVGTWNLVTRTLTVTANQPNAVRVTARRDGVANGPVTTVLAGIMGVNTMNVSSLATAALTAVSQALPGDIDAPFAISSQWFANNAAFCDQNIQFYPTNSPIGCAGWTTLNLTPSNSNTLRTQIIQPMIAGTYQSPPATAGLTQFNFIGGNVASALPDLRNLWIAKRDPATLEWPVFIPVYQQANCNNPSGLITIIGFAKAIVTNVLAPPAGQLVQARVECQLVDGGRGGGAPFGVVGSIPGLVE
jgi:Flp pilus assembly protein TadG